MDTSYDGLLAGALDAFSHADYHPFKGIEDRIRAGLKSRSAKKKASVLAELPGMLAKSDYQYVRDLGAIISDRLKAIGKRSIDSAYDAWWFLYNHPRLCLCFRTPEPKDNAKQMKAKGFVIKRDKCGKYWWLHRHSLYHAIEENLSIHYAKVDAEGHQNDDRALNLFPEVWLETGPMEWGYATPWDTETSRIPYHDTDLDCTGPTFDQALIALARLALKKYGDYKKDGGICGTPRCADCEEDRVA